MESCVWNIGGDVMKLQIRVDEKTNTISDVKFKTFGCGSAIASSSYLTELVRGMSLEDAGKIRNTEIAKELCLPPVKCEFVLSTSSLLAWFLKLLVVYMILSVGCDDGSGCEIALLVALSWIFEGNDANDDVDTLVHCSMLAEDAIKSAIKDYNTKRKTSAPTMGANLA